MVKITYDCYTSNIYDSGRQISYYNQAPEGFKLSPEVGNGIGLVAGLILAVLFFNKVRKVKSESNKEHIA